MRCEQHGGQCGAASLSRSDGGIWASTLARRATPRADACRRSASAVAEFFSDRTDVQCLHRWQKVLNPELVKGPWTPEVRPSERATGARGVCTPHGALLGLQLSTATRAHCCPRAQLGPTQASQLLAPPFSRASQEDEKINALVHSLGAKAWSKIASACRAALGSNAASGACAQADGAPVLPC